MGLSESEYLKYLELLLGKNTYVSNSNYNKSLNNAINAYNTTEVCNCNTQSQLKDYKMLDTIEVVEDLVNIVKQCYDECYSDDIPKEFIQKLYTRIENYLNEA